MITAKKLKKKYLKFFQKKGHTIIPSASLIPENDPTVLFTTAGMHPLVPYLLGEKHPGGTRLTGVQKCIRTVDFDNVGDNTHLTFFEMLGNWSLGDYWKEEAIKMSYDFLTQELKISPDQLAVTCFAGETENKIPKDDESAEIWKKLGLADNRIAFLGRADNWWGPAGQTGPCGPDTEMFYWTGAQPMPKNQNFDPADKRWVEIWNDVFMQYNKTPEGKYEPLKQKNVDTGMGLERTAAVLNGQDNVFATELFKPIISEIKKLATTENEKSTRIIADHLRTAVFILGDQKGIEPSNLDQGYVLRRLIRRAIRHGKMLGIDKPFTIEIAKIIINEYRADYPELKKNRDFVFEQLAREEEKFSQTLDRGLKEFQRIYLNTEGGVIKINGKEIFDLYQKIGFPFEMSIEEIKNAGFNINETGLLEEFNRELRKHQELSRTASAGKFKGGLADNSEVTARMHTAAHLMLAALRQVLGDHVFQKGSNITPERIRFDFSHGEKMTSQQIKQVEDLVNEQIKKNQPIVCQEISLDEAKAQGAMGVFNQKYGERVKVYSINGFSREICGGPHAHFTGELGHFKIIKEEASSAGVRRLKAILN